MVKKSLILFTTALLSRLFLSVCSKTKVTVQTAPLAKSKLRSVQFCETCGRQNAFFSHFVCIFVTVQRPV